MEGAESTPSPPVDALGKGTRQSNDLSRLDVHLRLHMRARVLKIAIQGHTADAREEAGGVGLSEGPLWRGGGAGGRVRDEEDESQREAIGDGEERERVVRGRVSRYSIGQKSIQGRPG